MAAAQVDLVDETDEGYTFRVVVVDGGREHRYRVTLSSEDFARLSRDGEDPAVFVDRCFAFLLDRESPSSILQEFDVSVISKYFPEFESVIAG